MGHMLLFEIIQLACVITLFIIILYQRKDLNIKNDEINELKCELDKLRFEVCKSEIKLTEELLELNKKLLPIMEKIKRNYSISKTDKLCLLEFFVLFMQNIKRSVIYKVDISIKFTYNEAADVIISFIKNPIYTSEQVQDVLNAIYYLLTK